MAVATANQPGKSANNTTATTTATAYCQQQTESKSQGLNEFGIVYNLFIRGRVRTFMHTATY